MDKNTYKSKLQEEYPIRVELHAHTKPASPCGELTPPEVVDIYADRGYDAIVITNHFTKELFKDLSKEEALDRYLKDYNAAAEQGKKRGIKVLLGAELRFTENMNDYLLYGADRDILSVCYDSFDIGIEGFRREHPMPKSVLVQAHPFRKNCTPCEPGLLDGFETFNMHPGHNASIGIAARFANEHNSPIKTIGSDFHHKNLGHEAVSALRLKALPEDSFQLAEMLKKDDYIFEIGETSLVLP